MVQPIVQDQYVAARAYFGAVVGLFFLEGATRHILLLRARLQNKKQKNASHWRVTVLLHAALNRSLPALPLLAGLHVLDLARFAVFAALNVAFALNDNQYTTDYKLYGWLTIANGGLALLLAARSNLFSLVLRVPAPVLLQYHRWIGLATVAHATVHIGFNIMHFVNTDQIASNLSSPRIRVGLMAWTSLAVMFLTALPIVRRRCFEVFYYAHFLFFVFMVGALYHTTKGPEFLLPGFALWVVDRAIRFAYNFRRITVQDVAYCRGGVTKLTLTGMRAAKPGQMVWVQLAGVSFLNWHPFTVASVTPDPAGPKTTLAVRGLGGYSRATQTLAEKEQGAAGAALRVRLDGPYGVGRFNWHDERLVVLVAGGVGITPALSIATSLIRTANQGGSPTRHIYLLWVVKDATHIAWFEKELRSLHNLARQPASGIQFDITIHVTGSFPVSESASIELKEPSTPEANEQPWTVENGRPALAPWFSKIKNAAPNVDAAVNACGPRSLVRDVRRASVLESSSSCLFRLEEESFEL